MARQEVANNGHEIEEPYSKVPKLHENDVAEVLQSPISFFRVKKLSEKAVLPTRASSLSAGYDLSRYTAIS